MNEKELLQAIREIIKEENQPIIARLDRMESDMSDLKERTANIEKDIVVMKEDIEQIKEDTEITRVATNTLVAWADKASVEVKIPLFDKAQ